MEPARYYQTIGIPLKSVGEMPPTHKYLTGANIEKSKKRMGQTPKTSLLGYETRLFPRPLGSVAGVLGLEGYLDEGSKLSRSFELFGGFAGVVQADILEHPNSGEHMSLKGTRHGCGVCMQEEPSLLKRAVCHCWTRARSSGAGAQGEVAARVAAARRLRLVLSIHS